MEMPELKTGMVVELGMDRELAAPIGLILTDHINNYGSIVLYINGEWDLVKDIDEYIVAVYSPDTGYDMNPVNLARTLNISESYKEFLVWEKHREVVCGDYMRKGRDFFIVSAVDTLSDGDLLYNLVNLINGRTVFTCPLLLPEFHRKTLEHFDLASKEEAMKYINEHREIF